LFSSFWAIAKNAFTEIIRQPVYGILLLASIALIAISPLFTMFSLGADSMGDVKILTDTGLATIFLTGIALAVLSASQVISREIDAKTAGTVMSKPVGRCLFVAAKFVGVTLALAAACYLLTIVLAITVRIGVPWHVGYPVDGPALLGLILPLLGALGLATYCNFFYRWNVTSVSVALALVFYTFGIIMLLFIGGEWNFEWIGASFQASHVEDIAVACGLVFLAVWVVSSIAVAASTRWNVVVTALVCVAVFFLGMVSQYMFGQYAESSHLAWVAYRAVPHLQAFWVADQLMQPDPFIPFSYLGVMAGYATAFCGAMVSFAAFLFERRELI